MEGILERKINFSNAQTSLTQRFDYKTGWSGFMQFCKFQMLWENDTAHQLKIYFFYFLFSVYISGTWTKQN